MPNYPYDLSVQQISDEMSEVKVNLVIAGYILKTDDELFTSLDRNGKTLGTLGYNFDLSILRVAKNYRDSHGMPRDETLAELRARLQGK